MYSEKTVLAVIVARGGSRGLPRKNLRPLAGKPLIAWSIEAACRSRHVDRLILSSEDEEIRRVSREWGCETLERPAALASDTARAVDCVQHAIDTLPDAYDMVVLLQPTSPLRTAVDIDHCIETCVDSNAPACVSVTPASKHPYLMHRLRTDRSLEPVIRLDGRPSSQRQAMPEVYTINGAVYVAEVDWFIQHRTFVADETRACVMPPERSVDIDTEVDLLLAQALLTSAAS